jgi:hypothetical protein
MLKLVWIVTFAGLMSAPVLAQTPAQGSIPDVADSERRRTGIPSEGGR